MMDNVTFTPSQQYAKEHGRAIYLRMAYAVILLPVSFWFLSAAVPSLFGIIPPISLTWQVVLAVLALVAGMSIAVFSHKEIALQQVAKFQQQQITLGSDSLMWRKDKKVQTIPYADIVQLVVSKGRNGRTQHIELHLNHTREKVSYFDDMDKMATLLETRLPLDTKRKQQTTYVNWEHPYTLLLVMVGGWLLGILLLKRFASDGGLFIFLGMSSGTAALYQYWVSPATPVSTKANRLSRAVLTVVTVAFYVGLWLITALADYPSMNHECHPFRRMVGQSSCIAVFEGDEYVAFVPNQPTLILHTSRVVWLQAIPNRWYSIPQLLRHDDWVDGFVLSADGQRLVSWTKSFWNEAKVWMWDVPEATLRYSQPVTTDGYHYSERVALHPSAEILATAPREQPTQIWATDNWQQISSLPEATAVAFSPSGALLAIAPAGEETAVQLWRVADLTLLQTLTIAEEGSFPISHITFSPDEQWVIANTFQSVFTWPLGNDSDSLNWLNGIGDLDTAPVFSPTGNILAAGVNNSKGDGYIGVWSVADGTLLATIPLGYDWPRSVAFSSDGSLLAVGEIGKAMVFQMDKVLP